eukprot:m51a1_g1872 hypothetical protein (258) ;mRNA; r:667075-667977
MKLEMSNREGRAFYAFKPWNGRAGDPDTQRAAKALQRGRMYSAASLHHLECSGAILRPPMAPDVVLVAKDAPELLGGSAQGFWKLLQRRLHLKHASSTLDRALHPVLHDVEVWLRDMPRPDAVAASADSSPFRHVVPVPPRTAPALVLPLVVSVVAVDDAAPAQAAAPQPSPSPVAGDEVQQTCSSGAAAAVDCVLVGDAEQLEQLEGIGASPVEQQQHFAFDGIEQYDPSDALFGAPMASGSGYEDPLGCGCFDQY